jgi:hypothetical protein
MGRVRITRLFVLLALAALLAPRIEASRTSVRESSPPASLATTRADAVGLPASLAPAAADDVDAAELPPFNLGDVVLVEREIEHEERFGLGSLTLVDLNLLRGPPPSYPETRVGGFELLPPFRVGAPASLSLWGRQACGFSCREVVSDSRYDPWGLITSIRAETGLPADQFGTVDIESGNVVLDATVLGVFNTVASGANRIANYGANVLAGLGWAQSKAEDVAVERLGMSRADVEFANIYLATNPANAALLGRGVQQATTAIARKGAELSRRLGQALQARYEIDQSVASSLPGAFGAIKRRTAPLKGSGGPGKVYDIDGSQLSTNKGYIGKTRQAELAKRMAGKDHRSKTPTGKPPTAGLLADELTLDEQAGVEALLIDDVGLENLTNKIRGLDLDAPKNRNRVEAGTKVLKKAMDEEQ